MRYYPDAKEVRGTETVETSRSWVENVNAENRRAEKWNSSFGEAYQQGMTWEPTPHVHMGVHSDAYHLNSVKMARHHLKEWTRSNIPWACTSLFTPSPNFSVSDVTADVPSDTVSLQHFIDPRQPSADSHFSGALQILRDRRSRTASVPLRPTQTNTVDPLSRISNGTPRIRSKQTDQQTYSQICQPVSYKSPTRTTQTRAANRPSSQVTDPNDPHHQWVAKSRNAWPVSPRKNTPQPIWKTGSPGTYTNQALLNRREKRIKEEYGRAFSAMHGLPRTISRQTRVEPLAVIAQ